MLALRRSLFSAPRAVRAFSATPRAMGKDAKEAALETEALEDDYQSSYGAGASLNKQNDEAAKISKKMGETAKEAADELEGQINSYEDAEAGLPPASGKSGDKGGK